MPIRAVLLDWAGTTVDHGCMAPVGVFVELFRRRGITVSLAEAREPMGTHKREHLRRMCANPGVAARWRSALGNDATDADIDAMYAEGEPLQIAVLEQYSDPIPGCLEVVAALRARGIKIGSSTGYNRKMLDVLVEVARARGYAPDVAVAASEVPEGRPAPFLNWTALQRLGVWPASQSVAVGDTILDVQAAKNAGCYAVGVTLTGNGVGVDAEGLAAMSAVDQLDAHRRVGLEMLAAGAHAVIPSIRELPGVVDALGRR